MRLMPRQWPRAAKRCSGASRRSRCRRWLRSTGSHSVAEWSSRSPAIIESPSSRTSGPSGCPKCNSGSTRVSAGRYAPCEILGPPLALDLMLTGRSLSPHEAFKCGLVDRVVAREALRSTAKDLIARPPPLRRAPWYLAIAESAAASRLARRPSACGRSQAREALSTIPRHTRSSTCGNDMAHAASRRSVQRPNRSAGCSSREPAAISCTCSSCANGCATSRQRTAE